MTHRTSGQTSLKVSGGGEGKGALGINDDAKWAEIKWMVVVSVCVLVCVCVHKYEYVQAHAHTHMLYTRTHTNTFTRTRIYVYGYKSKHASIRSHTYIQWTWQKPCIGRAWIE